MPTTTSSATSVSENPVRDQFESLLADYQRIRHEESLKHHPLHGVMRDVKERFETSEVVVAHPYLKVKPSLGQGRWAETPTIAFLDCRKTTTAQRGMFVIYRFRPDGTAMYLILGQGIDQAESTAHLRERVTTNRRHLEHLSALGFALADITGLRSKAHEDAVYSQSVIAHKRYEHGHIPDDPTLFADLNALLAAYERCLWVHKNASDGVADTASKRRGVRALRPATRQGGSVVKVRGHT